MSYISYTRNSIEFVMKTLVMKTFFSEKVKSKFDEFKDISKVKLKLIGCYKGNEKEISLKNLNKIKESFEDKNSFEKIFKNYQKEIKLYVIHLYCPKLIHLRKFLFERMYNKYILHYLMTHMLF